MKIQDENKNSVIEVFDSFVGQKNIKLSGKGNYLAILYKSDLKINFDIVDEKSDFKIFCVLLGEKNQKNIGKFYCNLKNNSVKADMYCFSLLLDESVVELDGWINIVENIENCEGHLLEENVILGKNVKIKTLPLLSVKSDNVKASHGAKIQKLSDEKLFYLQSKGLDLESSKELFVSGLVNRVFEEFEGIEGIDEVKNDLLNMVVFV